MKVNQSVFIVCSLPRESDAKPGGPFLSSPDTRDEGIDPGAEPVARWLAGSLAGRSIPTVRHGPEVPCRLTAVRLCYGGSHRTNIPSEAYRARRWGEWAGLSREVAQRRLEELGSDKRRRFCPSGGESWFDVERRVRGSLMSACDQDENFALVASPSVCRVALGILTGSPEQARNFAFANGSFVELRSDGSVWNLAGPPSTPPPSLS